MKYDFMSHGNVLGRSYTASEEELGTFPKPTFCVLSVFVTQAKELRDERAL